MEKKKEMTKSSKYVAWRIEMFYEMRKQYEADKKILDKMCENEINTLRTDLQSAQLQISQLSQTSNIVNSLRPTPIPAYLTCSPYESAFYGRFGNFGNCGCGCGCGNTTII